MHLTLFGYNELIQNGASPDDAMLAMAEALRQKRSGGLQQPEIPGVVPEQSMIPPQGGAPAAMPDMGAMMQ